MLYCISSVVLIIRQCRLEEHHSVSCWTPTALRSYIVAIQTCLELETATTNGSISAMFGEHDFGPGTRMPRGRLTRPTYRRNAMDVVRSVASSSQCELLGRWADHAQISSHRGSGAKTIRMVSAKRRPGRVPILQVPPDAAVIPSPLAETPSRGWITGANRTTIERAQRPSLRTS